MKDIIDLLARICIALIFLWEAWDSIANYESTKASMAGYNITSSQDFLLTSAIVSILCTCYLCDALLVE
jgi:uncharacterized membrane protein YphA (DoxX/SURF4 family)